MFAGVNKQTLLHETMKWLLMVLVFAIFALLLAPVARGMPPDSDAPGTLPQTIDGWSLPMSQPPATDPVEEPPRSAEPATADRLWTALDLHRGGQIEQARELWLHVVLPERNEPWRYLALAAADLRLRRLDEAAQLLSALEQTSTGDAAVRPLVHYHQALLCLTRAETADPWYDTTVERRFRLVAEGKTPAAELYRHAAIQHFEKAIETASAVRLDALLLPQPTLALYEAPVSSDLYVVALAQPPLPPSPYYPSYPMPYPREAPNVGDLLAAIGADNFVGKAHNMLGPLYLDKGLPDRAEGHMDLAVERGMNVQDGYSRLARQFAADGKHGDAFRANLKAMAHGDGLVKPASDAWQNLLNCLLDR